MYHTVLTILFFLTFYGPEVLRSIQIDNTIQSRYFIMCIMFTWSWFCIYPIFKTIKISNAWSWWMYWLGLSTFYEMFKYTSNVIYRSNYYELQWQIYLFITIIFGVYLILKRKTIRHPKESLKRIFNGKKI